MSAPRQREDEAKFRYTMLGTNCLHGVEAMTGGCADFVSPFRGLSLPWTLRVHVRRGGDGPEALPPCLPPVPFDRLTLECLIRQNAYSLRWIPVPPSYLEDDEEDVWRPYLVIACSSKGFFPRGKLHRFLVLHFVDTGEMFSLGAAMEAFSAPRFFASLVFTQAGIVRTPDEVVRIGLVKPKDVHPRVVLIPNRLARRRILEIARRCAEFPSRVDVRSRV
jgi:hypothetical protein